MNMDFLRSRSAEGRLVEGLLQGDEATYRQVYEAFAPRLRMLLLRIYRDPALADDAVQHTFLAVFRHIDQFNGQSSLYTWMTRIGINEASSLARKQARAKGRPTPPGEPVETDAEPPRSPEQQHALREEAQALAVAIAALPVDKRTALILFEVEGLSVQEIADITGTPRGTVLSRLSRTRAELREVMLAWRQQGSARAGGLRAVK